MRVCSDAMGIELQAILRCSGQLSHPNPHVVISSMCHCLGRGLATVLNVLTQCRVLRSLSGGDPKRSGMHLSASSIQCIQCIHQTELATFRRHSDSDSDRPTRRQGRLGAAQWEGIDKPKQAESSEMRAVTRGHRPSSPRQGMLALGLTSGQ